MKRLIVIIALLVAAPARGDKLTVTWSDPPPSAGPTWKWNALDYSLQATLVGLIALDWIQTIEFTQNDYHWPSGERWAEQNPLLGDHPSRAKVNTLIPIAIIAHTTVAALLPHGPARTIWQSVFITAEGYVVHRNYQMGVRFRF